MSSKSKSTIRATPKDKDTKEKDLPFEEKPTPTASPVNIHLKIENIKHAQYFKKFSNQFSIEISHCSQVISATNPNDGDFTLCSCPTDDELIADDIDLNLHYIIKVQPHENDLRFLMGCPLCVTLILHMNEADVTKDTDLETLNLLKKLNVKQDLFLNAEHENNDHVANEVRFAKMNNEKQNRKKNKTKLKTFESSSNETKQNYDSNNETNQDKRKLLKIPLGFGCLDLLPYVTEKNIDHYTTVYLYPKVVLASAKTPNILIHIYTVVGILKNIPFELCNIVIISLESIFNIPKFMEDTNAGTRVSLSLIVNSNIETLGIFTFSDGKTARYADRTLPKQWSQFPKVLTSEKLSVCPCSLKGVYTDNWNMVNNFEMGSLVLMFNSIYRCIISENDSLNLEHLINQLNKHIILEISTDNDDDPKYIGYLDLSPLLYPDVKEGRFCVVLHNQTVKKSYHGSGSVPFKPHKDVSKQFANDKEIHLENLPKLTAVSQKTKKKPTINNRDLKSNTTDQAIDVKFDNKIMFAVVGFQLLQPITEKSEKKKFGLNNMFETKCACEEKPCFSKDFVINSIMRNIDNEIVTALENIPKDFEVKNDQSTYDYVKETSCFKGIKYNLQDHITKLIAAKYTEKYPTKNNSEFKNLIAKVYNKLNDRINYITNEHYSGSNTSLEAFENMAIHNHHLFTAKEARELSFPQVESAMWALINERGAAHRDEAILTDLVIKELEILQLDKALEQVKVLLEVAPNSYHGLLLKAYIDYVVCDEDEEVLLGQLLKIAKANPNEIEIWVLLKIIFSKSNYRPGYIHADMKYQFNYPPETMKWFWDRKELYINAKPNQSPLCYSVYVFLRMAMFKFARLIFDNCNNDFEEYDRYFVQCTLYFLQQQYSALETYVSEIPSSSKNIAVKRLFAGYSKYKQDFISGAAMNFEYIYHSLDSNEYFHIPFLYCGFADIAKKKYRSARNYFITCCKNSESFLSWYGLGVCCYRLGDFKESEIYLQKATNICSDMPELWIYLTMINLKTGNIDKAKKCYILIKRQSSANNDLYTEMFSTFSETNSKVPSPF